MLSALRWRTVITETGNFPGNPFLVHLRTSFNIPQHLLYPTFRVWLTETPTPYTHGLVLVKLRFGYDDPDTDVAAQGIDFAPLASANASDTRSPMWLSASIPPNFVGSQTNIPGPGIQLGVLPPRVDLFLNTDTNLGFLGTYHVAVAGVIVG